jgi:hypothetical protein
METITSIAVFLFCLPFIGICKVAYDELAKDKAKAEWQFNNPS